MASHKLFCSAGFFFILALLILLVPFSWLGAMVAAAAFHECCHYFSIVLLTGRRTGIRLLSDSAKIPLPEMTPWQEVVCALAGPLGGLALIPLYTVFPRLAFCGLVHSVYNLLPIYPLDGGRLLRYVLSGVLQPPKVDNMMKVVAVVIRVCVCLVGIFCTFYLHFGIFPILIAILICIRAK